MQKGSRCDVVTIMLNCDIVLNEFELQSGYCVRFQINTLGENMEHLSSSYGLKGTITVLLAHWPSG